MAQEEREQRKFPGLEVDRLAAAGHVAGDEVEGHVAGGQPRGFRRRGGATNQRLDPGQQFGKRERLREIVVAAGLEPADPIVDGALRAQEKDGRRLARGPEAFDQADAVELGQHHVDDGGVVVRRLDERQARLAVGGMIDRIPRLLQAAGDERGNLGIIFDDEDAHEWRKGSRAKSEGGGDERESWARGRPARNLFARSTLGRGDARVPGKLKRPRLSRDRGRVLLVTT